MTDGKQLETRVYFKPQPLEKLLLVDELANMAPLTDAKVENETLSRPSLQ